MVAASVALAGVLSGCDGDTKTAAAGSPTPAASSTPSAVSSGSAAASASASPADPAPAALLRQASDAADAAKSAKITQTITDGTGTHQVSGVLSWASGLQGSLQGKIPAATAAKIGSDGTEEIRYLPNALYINMHAGDQFVKAMGGAHWIEQDYADLDQTPGSDSAQLSATMKIGDPVSVVRLLAASGTAKQVGPDTVDGVQATHFSGDVTSETLAAGQGLSPELLNQERQLWQSQGLTKDHIDVWVDGNNRIVKRHSSLTTKTGPKEMEFKYSDYGTPVQVTAPPASDTINAKALKASSKPGPA